MAYEMQENSGSLFKNDKKTTDKHPDLTGACKIDGKEYWLSSWKKYDNDGKLKFLSMAFTEKKASIMDQSPEIEDDF